MALSDLHVFNDYAYSTLSEVLMQQVALFNAATNNAIVLKAAANLGDYNDEASWKLLDGLVRRRNVYGQGAVTPLDLEHLLNTSVKVASGTPPVNMPPSQMTWIRHDPKAAGAVVGQQLAQAAMSDMLNTALMVGRVALSQVTEVVYNGTGDTVNTLDAKQLNNGQRAFGDHAQDIALWVSHSKPMFDFYGTAIDNDSSLFSYGTINVVSDPFGRPFVVTDSPSLVTTGAPDTYHTMGLVSGAIVVEQNGDFDSNVDTTNGDENIARTFQAEWTNQYGIKGFAWDKEGGSHSPNDAALGTATNWNQYSTDIKSLAGVVVDTR